MLVLTRGVGETIRIGEDVVVTILGIIAAISSLNPPMVHLQALAATG